MKPFNLEEALAGKPVVTRDKSKVTTLSVFNDINDTKKVLAISNGRANFYTPSGTYNENARMISVLDLFIAKST